MRNKLFILTLFIIINFTSHPMDSTFAEASADRSVPVRHSSKNDGGVASGFFGQANLTSADRSEKPPVSLNMQLVQQHGLMQYLISKMGIAQHENGSFSDHEFPESIRKRILNYIIDAEVPQWKLRHLLTACTKSIAIDNSDDRRLFSIRKMIHNPYKPEIATISNNILTITDTITDLSTYKHDMTPPNDMDINILKYDQNGTSLAIGSSDRKNRNLIITFDLESKDVRSFMTLSCVVSACDFNADGTELITTYAGHPIIEVWNSTNVNPRKIPVHKPAYAVKCCPIAQVVAIGHTDGTVTLWDAHTYEQRAILTTNALDKGVIDLLTFNHDGTKLAAGSTNVIKEIRDEHRGLLTAEVAHVIQTWNINNKFESNYFTAHSSEYADRLKSITYDPASRYLIIFSSLSSIRFWDLAHNICALTLNGEASLAFHATFNPSGSHVMHPGNDSQVTIWNLSLAHKVVNQKLTYEQAWLLNAIVPENDVWNTIDKLYKEYNNSPENASAIHNACTIIKESFYRLPEDRRNKLIEIGFDVDNPNHTT